MTRALCTAILTFKTKTTKTKQKPSDFGSFLCHGQVFLKPRFLVEIYSLTIQLQIVGLGIKNKKVNFAEKLILFHKILEIFWI